MLHQNGTPASAESQLLLTQPGTTPTLDVATFTEATDLAGSGDAPIVEILICERSVDVATNGESYAEQYYRHPVANRAIARLIASQVNQIRGIVKAALERRAARAQARNGGDNA